MKSIAAIAALALVSGAAAQGLTVNSPQNVVECQPFQFTWTGGSPPYFLSLIPGAGQNPIKQFPQQTGTSFTWNVDLPTGTNFIASLKDSSGANAFAASASVIAGSDTSCVNTAVQDSGSASAGSGSTAAGGSSASATASGSASGSSKPSGTSSSSSSSPSKTGAATVGASVSTFGIAGLFGLVGAVLF